MSLAPGQQVLGRYRVEELLGEGAMGQVFRGLHEHLDLAVAIKVLRGDLTADILGRFEREAKLMARVRHPNTVAVQDYGFLDDGSPCLVMEFIEGEPLDDRLKRCGALPWLEVLHLAQGLLGGLGALHTAGVLHRDLKPSNVVIAPGDPETPKLIDFGIARPTDGEESRITRTGVLVGTPAYMAPEQILCTRLGPRTDLYSLGLVVYELLTGDLPYPTTDMASVMRRLKESIPAPVAPAGRPRIPEAVARAIVTVCSTEERHRPASASDVAALLRRAAADVPERATALRTTVTDGTSPGARATDAAWDRIQAGDVTGERRYLVAARLPPSRLRSREDRHWLATLTEGHGRGFTLGAHLWFALQGTPEDLRGARRRGEAIRAAIEEHYGETVTVRISLVDGDFTLTGAALVGGAPLPDPLKELITALSG
ncbi:MAG: serine/threonine-protein kinase [Pseudomonadota bacterium]